MSAAGQAVAALRVFGLEVDLAGRVCRIPALPAAAWLEVVWNDESSALPFVALLDPEDQAAVMWAMLAGDLTIEDLAQRCRDILATVTGRRWWEADRLIRSAAPSWGFIGGELTRLGVDLERVSIAAALNAIYVVCARTMTEEERKRFDMELTMAPVNATEAEKEQAMEATAAAFLAALGPPPSIPPG